MEKAAFKILWIGAVALVCAVTFAACTPGEALSNLAGDAAATMPDPSGLADGSVSPGQFWGTWGAMLAMHEIKDFISWWRKKKKNGD